MGPKPSLCQVVSMRFQNSLAQVGCLQSLRSAFACFKHRGFAGFLLVFDSAGSLWRSNDWGRSWLKLVQKLPFGWPHEQALGTAAPEAANSCRPRSCSICSSLSSCKLLSARVPARLGNHRAFKYVLHHTLLATKVSFVRYSSGALVAVTMSTRVWVSQASTSAVGPVGLDLS